MCPNSGPVPTATAEGIDPAAVTVSQPSAFPDATILQGDKSNGTNVYVIEEKVQLKTYENTAFERCH